jgi:Sec-independent protein translocase protein TatA
MPDLLLILIVILVLVIVWRGPKTLPSLGEALGRGVREAKAEAAKAQEEIQAHASSEPVDQPVPPADEAIPPTPPASGTDRPA